MVAKREHNEKYYAVVCPRCGAPEGRQCHRPGQANIWTPPHKGRKELVDGQRLEVQDDAA